MCWLVTCKIFFHRQIQSTCLGENTFLKSDIHNVLVNGKLYVKYKFGNK